MQRQPDDVSAIRESLDAIHELLHEEEATTILALDAAARRVDRTSGEVEASPLVGDLDDVVSLSSEAGGAFPRAPKRRAVRRWNPPARRLRSVQKLSSARSRVSAIWKSVSSFVSSNSVLRSSLRLASRNSPPCSRIF